MGDLFHQTNAQQTSTNQQVGVSTRDVGGSASVAGAGAISTAGGTTNVVKEGASNVTISTLDPEALQAAAYIAHDAITASAGQSAAAIESYQKALTISGETAAQALEVAKAGAGTGVLGLNPTQLILIVGGIVAAVFVIGKLRK